MIQPHEERDNIKILGTAFSVFTKAMVHILDVKELGAMSKDTYLKDADAANSIAVVLQNKVRG